MPFVGRTKRAKRSKFLRQNARRQPLFAHHDRDATVRLAAHHLERREILADVAPGPSQFRHHIMSPSHAANPLGIAPRVRRHAG
jgi:hypothetical protein